MQTDKAIKLTVESMEAEIKRLAPLANMAEPPAGIPALPTPGALRAAEQRRNLRDAIETLQNATAKQMSFLEAA